MFTPDRMHETTLYLGVIEHVCWFQIEGEPRDQIKASISKLISSVQLWYSYSYVHDTTSNHFDFDFSLKMCCCDELSSQIFCPQWTYICVYFWKKKVVRGNNQHKCSYLALHIFRILLIHYLSPHYGTASQADLGIFTSNSKRSILMVSDWNN